MLGLLRQHHGVDRRHAGNAGDRFVSHPLVRLRRIGEGTLQHQGCASPYRGKPLKQPISEIERQGGKQTIILGKTQILIDAVQREQQRLMGVHHPFRLAARAGGVDQSGQIQADHRPGRRRGQLVGQRRFKIGHAGG